MNMRSLLQGIGILCLCLLLSSQVLASGHGHTKQVKKGILLVAFGSSYPQARASFENIEAEVEKAFPGVPVRWAYTSKIIRHKLAKEGKKLDSASMALARMMDEDFTHVAVQSLHTIGGAEFHDLLSIVNGFESMPDGFTKILVGYPLLASSHDLEAVREAMLANIPDERKPDEAVIFMGHGTHHPSNAFYQAMAYEFQRKDANVYVGTVEGAPSLEDILVELEAKGTDKAWLMPFMSVAGDHVRNDMAGDAPDSWTSILAEAGIETETVLKGTAEFDNIVDIWVEHLKGAFSHFEQHP
ncbi:MAG: sirohydrochlorin cobaltochelatase [Desulfohalobiaceae bacterium]|nr:sirohydrochlorin cobaltochelatase [Desulfohalobiaceae bacterium]